MLPRFRFLTVVAVVWCCLGFQSVSFAQMGWRLGQQVEVLTLGKWYPAEIVAVREGKYEVHYAGLEDNRNEWVLSTRIRPKAATDVPEAKPGVTPSITSAPAYAPASSATASASGVVSASENSSSPRLGKYTVTSIGGSSGTPVAMGAFELLADGKYRFLDNNGRPVGEGQYTFDAAGKQLKWVSGPFQRTGWSGGWEVSPEGRTHTIKLTKVVSGTNTGE
jgi:hypothetical protein